ncbi:MAG: hypothetical protein QG609_287 [Patescibacteria group bacterium]|nr:hypothetical protein [Patescibacteria group bacterium]
MMGAFGQVLGIVSGLVSLVVLIDLVLVGVWLWQKISKK